MNTETARRQGVSAASFACLESFAHSRSTLLLIAETDQQYDADMKRSFKEGGIEICRDEICHYSPTSACAKPETSGELFADAMDSVVGRCRFTVSKPVLKAPMVQRLKLQYDEPLSHFAFTFNLRRYTVGGTGDAIFRGDADVFIG